MNPKRTCRQDGYTLIELLVAMLLLGLVGLTITGGIQFGARVWEHSETNISDTEALDMTQGILREFLSVAVPNRAGGFARFDGQSRNVSFYAPAPRALTGGGLAHF